MKKGLKQFSSLDTILSNVALVLSKIGFLDVGWVVRGRHLVNWVATFELTHSFTIWTLCGMLSQRNIAQVQRVINVFQQSL